MKWLPMTPETLFAGGEEYLFAVETTAGWEISQVRARLGPETPLTFDGMDGEPWGAWDVSDVQFYLPVAAIDRAWFQGGYST